MFQVTQRGDFEEPPEEVFDFVVDLRNERGWHPMLKWVEAVGAEHSTLGSDLGQEANPLPTESFRKIVTGLLDRGMPERDVRRMVADNPRRLLGAA